MSIKSAQIMKETPMSKIAPCLWFDGQAEEAAKFYVSLLPNSRIDGIHRSPTDYPSGKKGDVLTVDFTLDGRKFVGLNGGSHFKFNEAVSFQIPCRDQDEVDHYWEKLGEGGEHGPCGWLKDRFGLSWQVVPTRLTELLEDPDREKSQRVMAAMLQMGKIEIDELERAAAA
jgi:predicted 3-demethylubiquinone-9 3-methyltransferase (glyoxalase superfamily)